MGPVEALEFAVNKEAEAVELYRKFYIAHPQLKDTFSFLINEEEKHKKLLERKIRELTI